MHVTIQAVSDFIAHVFPKYLINNILNFLKTTLFSVKTPVASTFLALF